MKRGLLIITICLLFTVGCTKTETKMLTCTLSKTQDNVELNLKYEIEHDDKYVISLKSTEKIISDNTDILKLYRTTVQQIYQPYDDLKYYDYNIRVSGNTLTSTVKINYAKIDIDKFIEIDSTNENIIEDGKVLLKTIKESYEKIGTTCE